MASSVPNPYGLPQGSPSSSSATKNYYGDYSNSSSENATAPAFAPALSLADGDQKSLVLSSSLLANYDANYIGGMSSDSELTSSSATRHHHHHYHHHRPYSSQSRVYHAHPVPRNSAASSRLSHFSDSAALSNVQSAPTASYNVQQQQQQAAIMASQVDSTTMSHPGGISSDASASAPYLAGTVMSESQSAPSAPSQQQQQQKQQQLAARTKTARQLPQRPFKQSMSIDHQSIGSSGHYQPFAQVAGRSPIHHSSLGSQRNFMGEGSQMDPVIYQQQQQLQCQNYPISHRFGAHSSPYSLTNQRNLQLEMELLEKQAANMNMYEAAINDNSTSSLPPSIPSRPSSSSSTRHLQNVSTNQAQGPIGSMSFDQQQHHHHHRHHHQDPYHQQQKLNQDPYLAKQQQHQQQLQQQHQINATQSDWQSPLSGPHQLSRSGGQFKQTMSIDHYASAPNRHQQSYSPARAPLFSADQYHSLGSYAGAPQQSLSAGVSSYDSPAKQHSTYYPTGGQEQDAFYSQHQASVQHRNEHKLPPPAPSSEYTGKQFERAASCNSAGYSAGQHQTQSQQTQQQGSLPRLQHQLSSSSSNSNQSGSMRSSNVDGNLDKSASAEYQKSIPSASSALSQYHHSPQHRTSGLASRQDMLRRGYTSVTMTSGYGVDFGGSQTALSESGDLTQQSTTSINQFNIKRSGLRAASPSVVPEASTSSGHYHHHHQQHHSTSSSHGAREVAGMRSESSTGLPNGMGGNSTLTKKSNSATQLSMTGTKKRLGFRKKQVTSFSVHRSEEVAPLEARHLVKQGSSVSEGDSSVSGDSSSRSWSNSNFKQQTSEELASMSFIDGLGKGQMISRQGLASPYLGDIQLSLCDRRGNLELEIIRARNLQAKKQNKVQPLTYVKLYLVKNRKCLAKAKTTLSDKRTLNPFFQQQLTFHEDYRGCILQSIVWGNFGKMDKKNFMGIAQISLDDLELGDTVISWYKLFLPSSLQTLPSKSLRHTLLSNSTESFTNTNNS